MKKHLLLIVLAAVTAMSAQAVSFYYTYNNQRLKFTVIDQEAKTCMLAQYDLSGSLSFKVSPHNLKGDVVIPEIALREGKIEYRVIEIGEMSLHGNQISSVTIPSSVTKIGAKAFSNTLLESITLPEGITEIPDGAFNECMYLESVKIPESVISIGAEAFAECYSIKSIHLPGSLQSIGRRAFSSCMGIHQIELTESLKTIGHRAFSSSGLRSVSIPKSVTTIGQGTFFNCNDLESATILATVSEIPEGMFEYCHNLKSVELPESVTSIDETAFFQCYELESIELPKGVVSIGTRSFSNCFALKNVTLPESLITLGDYAFQYCTSLETITLPQNLTSIGTAALQGAKLTTLIIPSSVSKIEKTAFGRCTDLKSVYYSADAPQEFSGDLFSETTFANATLYVSSNAANACRQLSPWNQFKSISTFNPTEAKEYHPLLENNKSWTFGHIVTNRAYLNNNAQMPCYQKIDCTYKVMGDTLIEDTNCKIVGYYRSDLNRNITYMLHEENGIISMYLNGHYKHPFVKIIDFNAMPGNELKVLPYDTFEPLWDYYYLTYNVVDSKFAQGNDRITRKEIVLNDSTSWVEGIGGSHENWLVYQSIWPSGTNDTPNQHLIECRKDGEIIFSAKDFAYSNPHGLANAKTITPGKSWTMARGSEILTFIVGRDTVCSNVPCRVISCSDGKEYVVTEESGMVYGFSDRFGEANPNNNAFPITGNGEIDQIIYRVDGSACSYIEDSNWKISNIVNINVNALSFKEHYISENADESGEVVASWVDGVGAPDSRSWAVVMPEDFQTLRMIDCRQDGEVIFRAEDFTYQSSISEVSAPAAAPAATYDLQGRRVACPTRGLYIVNGKKQLIK